MLIRRCAHLIIEPVESLTLDFTEFLGGHLGLRGSGSWQARAPHLPAPVAVVVAEIEVLGRISEVLWVEYQRTAALADEALLQKLLACGLLVADDAAHAHWRARDEAMRAQAWYAASAHLHHASRWQGVHNVPNDPHRADAPSLDDIELRHGPIPTHEVAHLPADQRLPLPTVAPGALDALLQRRATCRNFDRGHWLPLADLARVLRSVFGGHGLRQLARHGFAVKKNVPSGGALHPIEAYLIVRQVAGLQAGLYHYHVGDHALEPLRELDAVAAQQLALTAVAGQQWFADAPVQIVLVARFHRNFWKYRNHAKAYRVIQLDAGHLSQTWFLAASELGLGAFITAAINEIDIEQAFGFDGMRDGPLAVLGLGARAPTQQTREFDPAGVVWG